MKPIGLQRSAPRAQGNCMVAGMLSHFQFIVNVMGGVGGRGGDENETLMMVQVIVAVDDGIATARMEIPDDCMVSHICHIGSANATQRGPSIPFFVYAGCARAKWHGAFACMAKDKYLSAWW